MVAGIDQECLMVRYHDMVRYHEKNHDTIMLAMSSRPMVSDKYQKHYI